MHIGINTVSAETGPFPHHVVRYLAQIIAQIPQEKNHLTFSCFHDADVAPPLGGMPGIPVERAGGGFQSLLRRGNNLESALQQHNIDLVVSPIQSPCLKTTVPQILVALDLAPWDRGGAGAPGFKNTKKACATARHIIAPTEHVRRRCLELFEAPMEKIVVAAPGVSPNLSKPTLSVVEKPYVVMFFDPLTAPLLHTVREAMELRKDEFPQTQVIVGPTLPDEPEQWGPRVVRIEQCPDAHLAGLYREADFFLYPAPDDGSGLRVLEALAAGVPVLAAGSRGVMEVAGDAPIYFNGESLDSFFQSLKRVLTEEKQLRAKRIHTGTQIAARFAWDKSMWKVLTTFKAG
jgi:glycosyltransferase involved in cell wall biosynthesis